MKIVCVDNVRELEHNYLLERLPLTIGRFYIAREHKNDRYLLIDDDGIINNPLGVANWYDSKLFVTESEYRNLKLESLL